MNTRLIVRPITPDDAEEVARLLARVIGSRVATALEPVAATVKGQRAFIESLPERASYLAAVDADSGAIVGVQDVLPNERDLRVGDISTFVDMERARTGVGAALTEATLERTRAHGFEELHAVIQRRNDGARAFYRSRGFVEHAGRTAETVVGVLALIGDGAPSSRSGPVPVPGRFRVGRSGRRSSLDTVPMHQRAVMAFVAALLTSLSTALLAHTHVGVGLGERTFLLSWLWWSVHLVWPPWLLMAVPYFLRVGDDRGAVSIGRGLGPVGVMVFAWTVVIAMIVFGSVDSDDMVFLIGTLAFAIPFAVVVGLPIAGGCVFGYGALWGIAEGLDTARRRTFVRGSAVASSIAVALVVGAHLAGW